MDWYKQYADYYLDPRMIAAGEDAEVLHLRAKAYVSRAETAGFLPENSLILITPKRWKQRAARLVDVGLWKRTDGGYLIVDWEDEQSELEALAARRRSDRDRKRAQRDREREQSRDSHVTGNVTTGVTGHGTNLRIREKSKSREEPNYSSSSAGADDGQPEAKPKRQKRPTAERFDDFWRVYPRRVGKIAALKAYTKAVTAGATPDELIAGASFYAMEKKLSEPQYIKHPATWLNGGCWQDEPDPAYKPPAIGAPSDAVRNPAYRPVAEVLAEQARFGGSADEPPF